MGGPNSEARARVLRRPRLAFSSLASALRNPDILRVELVWAVAIGAEWAHFVALGVFAYDHGGASFVGLAGLVRLLPAGALAPFASSLGDRVRRERLLLVLLFLEVVALIASGAAAWADDRVAVLALAAVVGATSTLVRPAVQSILPLLAHTTTELIASNGASSTFEALGALGGPLIVGATIGFVGTGGVFIAGGVTLLAAVAILAGVNVPSPTVGRAGNASRPAGGSAGRAMSSLHAGLAGLDRVGRDSRLRLLVLLAGAQCFVRGCLNVLLVVAAFDLLHAGSSGVGYLNAALGVGGLVGAFGAATLSTKRLALSFGLAIAFWGLPIALLSPLSWLGAAMLCLVVVGVANAVEDVGLMTLVQRCSPYELLASVLGVLWGVNMTAVAVGSIVAPVIESAFGPRTALLMVGLILPVLALASGRSLRRIDTALQPSEGLELVEAIPMFAPLSIAAKERVAASLSQVAVTAGETVVSMGEPGDTFYIVGTGRFGIERDGKQVASAERGDYFGEIALVQDVPRTASVRAEVDSKLYALGRGPFFAAITLHPEAVAAARQVAAERGPNLDHPLPDAGNTGQAGPT
jgi:MFS family permease